MTDGAKNIPLSTDQKLVVSNLQRKLLNLQLQTQNLTQQLQQELNKIAVDNKIEAGFGLNDELEIVPPVSIKS